MNTSAILFKKAGQKVPQDFLDMFFKNNSSAYGLSIIDKQGADAVLDTIGFAQQGTSKDIETVDADKLPMTLWAANATQDFDKVQNLQPFTFQMSVQGEPKPEDILAVFIEGDFPKYSKPGGGHTEEYNFWEEYLFPLILEKFELAHGDIEDFYKRLSTSLTKQTILAGVGHRAVITMVPLEGEPITVSNNELGAEYEWGWTSNKYTYGDKSATEKITDGAAAVVHAVKGRTSRLAQALGTTALAPVAAPEKKEEEKVVQNPKGNRALSGKTLRMVPPKGLSGNARNTWIRTFMMIGQDDPLPKNKDHSDFTVEVPVELTGFAQEDGLTTKEEARLIQARVKTFLTDGVVTPPAKPDEVKNPPKETPSAKPEADTRHTRDFLPDISADDKRGAVELVTGWASKPKDKAPTALEIQRIESKWPALSTTMGIRFEDMCRWPIADVKHLAKKYPDVMALAFVEMRLKAIENSGIKLDDVPKPDAKPAEKQVEVPSPQPGAAPAKTSRLARLTGNAA